MVKLYSTKDSRKKEQIQLLLSKNSSPLHVMDSAVLGSMGQSLELVHTFLVEEKDADQARKLLQAGL